jgi:response regulator RpfG family c-di-GMP phosphodiesterase
MPTTPIEQAPDAQPNTVPKPLGLVDAVFAALSGGIGDNREKTEAGDSSLASADVEDVPWILCIDDDADFSDALRIRFEEHGVAVVRAFSGMEGYRMAFTSPARLILLDFHMPNGQGDYILRRLKENPVTKSIPVFILSGAKDRVLQRRLIAMGAVEFFEKPVDFKRLRERMADYIDILDHGVSDGPLAQANAHRQEQIVD